MKQFFTWIKQHTSDKITINKVFLTSPIDYGAIFQVVTDHIEAVQLRHGKTAKLVFHMSPGTPAIVLYNVYKAISAAPIILPMSQKSTVITTHPLGLPLTKGAMMASFFGITALPRVTLKFESKPSGVQVYRQGDPNPIGRSPLEFEVVKSDQMATYRFEARGYRSVSMEVSHAAAYNGFVYMQKRKKTRNNMTVPD